MTRDGSLQSECSGPRPCPFSLAGLGTIQDLGNSMAASDELRARPVPQDSPDKRARFALRESKMGDRGIYFCFPSPGLIISSRICFSTSVR